MGCSDYVKELKYLQIRLDQSNMDEPQIKEALLEKAVEQSTIDVPEDQVEREYTALVQAAKQKIRYEYMAEGQPFYGFPESLYTALESLRAEAYCSVKTELLLQAVIEAEHLEISREELEREGLASAKRLEVTPEMARMFYGDDYGLLKNDLLRRKAIDLIYEHAVLV